MKYKIMEMENDMKRINTDYEQNRLTSENKSKKILDEQKFFYENVIFFLLQNYNKNKKKIVNLRSSIKSVKSIIRKKNY